MSGRRIHPDETPEQVAAALRRSHPELTDRQIQALLTGPAVRPRRKPPLFDNRGKRGSRYEATSAGRTTSARIPAMGDSGE